MTPKEKAVELYEKFHKLASRGGYFTDVEYVPGDDETLHKNAIECSKIAVAEILELAKRPDLFEMMNKRQLLNGFVPDVNYIEFWDGVHTELLKL